MQKTAKRTLVPLYTSVAFVPATPRALSAAVQEFIFASVWQDGKIEVQGVVESRSHMAARLEDVTARWIACRKLGELQRLSTCILATGRRIKQKIQHPGHEHTLGEMAALRVIYLMEFVERGLELRSFEESRRHQWPEETKPLPLP